ncbi:MAG TPA: hypothetical protein VJG66_00770 [Patescibacteria group bacterium]|nr:hypothetical protein [Patescibacteria group bacterium]
MIWQDIVLGGAQIFFAISLLPSVFSKDKPALATSIMTSLTLYVICYVNFTLNLYGASAGLFIVATLWGILAIQKHIIDKRKSFK